MPPANYGVLKGKAIDSRDGMGQSPHFQILIVDDNLWRRQNCCITWMRTSTIR
jgi:uncharacterized protein YukJ